MTNFGNLEAELSIDLTKDFYFRVADCRFFDLHDNSLVPSVWGCFLNILSLFEKERTEKNLIA